MYTSKEKVILKRIKEMLDKVAAVVAMLALGAFAKSTPDGFVWGAVGLFVAAALWGVATWVATEVDSEGR